MSAKEPSHRLSRGTGRGVMQRDYRSTVDLACSTTSLAFCTTLSILSPTASAGRVVGPLARAASICVARSVASPVLNAAATASAWPVATRRLTSAAWLVTSSADQLLVLTYVSRMAMRFLGMMTALLPVHTTCSADAASAQPPRSINVTNNRNVFLNFFICVPPSRGEPFSPLLTSTNMALQVPLLQFNRICGIGGKPAADQPCNVLSSPLLEDSAASAAGS